MDSSTVVVTYDGTDITNKVIFASSTFEAQMNAVPGAFEMTVKDMARELDFVTGKQVTLEIDGVLMYGGYLTSISRAHAFDADDTTPTEAYKNRLWILRGVDFNILYDKRVLRNTDDYLSQIPNELGSTQDGAIARAALTSYIDLPSGFDGTTFIDDVRAIHDFDTSKAWAWPQQGSKLRDLFTELSIWAGQVWYVDAAKNFHYHALDTAEHRWGFSDQPNYVGITTSPAEFQGATYGLREIEAVEDGSVLVNDALIWGGSAYAGPSGGTVFARSEDATSESLHSRWQWAETHFGESGFGIQAGVDARADALVNGPPGVDVYGQQKGLRYPQWTFRFGWFAKDVPLLSGQRDHILPGDVVTIEMGIFGVTKLLPCRSIKISFVEQDQEGTFVRFDADFGIQTSDPFALWAYLLGNEQRVKDTIFATANQDSITAQYGAFFQGSLSPAPDGVETVFFMPVGYIAGTLVLYVDGLLQRRGTDYDESDPEAGEITMVVAPASDDNLYATARTLAT